MCGAWQPGGLRERVPEDPWLCVPASRRVCRVFRPYRRQPIWLPSMRTSLRPRPRRTPMGRKSCLVHRGNRVFAAADATAQPRLDDPARPSSRGVAIGRGSPIQDCCRGPASLAIEPARRAAARSRSPGRTRSRASAAGRAATSCSTPSAMTVSRSARPSATIALDELPGVGVGPSTSTKSRAILSDVDREPLEVAERRVAGAEVVDRDADAERRAGRCELGDASRRVSCSIAVSVISRTSAVGVDAGRRERSSATSSTKSGCASWRAETLTLTVNGRPREPVVPARGLPARLARAPSGRSAGSGRSPRRRG